jgi:hypothetical protein
MPKQTLKQSVDTLRDYIEGIDVNSNPSDAESQNLTEDNIAQVEGLAAKIEAQLESGDLSDWDEDLISEVEQNAILFDEEHPVIAGALKSVMNALNSIGI